MQSYKRTPNIFTLVQKVKISYLFFLYLLINVGFAKALKVISFQNDLYVLRGRSPSKGTIISKIHTFFYNSKHSEETLSVYNLLV